LAADLTVENEGLKKQLSQQGRVRVEVIEAEIIEAYNNWLSTTDEITVGFHKAAQAIVKLVEGER
jgi:hypothetical protein